MRWWSVISWSRDHPRIYLGFFCLYSLNSKDEKFHLCSLNSWDFVYYSSNVRYLLPLHWNIKPTWLWPSNSSKHFYRFFFTPFIYYLFMEPYMHILIVETRLRIFVNSAFMYIRYVLNVSMCDWVCLCFRIFRVSLSLAILMLILNLGKWMRYYVQLKVRFSLAYLSCWYLPCTREKRLGKIFFLYIFTQL